MSQIRKSRLFSGPHPGTIRCFVQCRGVGTLDFFIFIKKEGGGKKNDKRKGNNSTSACVSARAVVAGHRPKLQYRMKSKIKRANVKRWRGKCNQCKCSDLLCPLPTARAHPPLLVAGTAENSRGSVPLRAQCHGYSAGAEVCGEQRAYSMLRSHY